MTFECDKSPALKLGFVNFEMGTWGLTNDFPKKWLAKEPPNLLQKGLHYEATVTPLIAAGMVLPVIAFLSRWRANQVKDSAW